MSLPRGTAVRRDAGLWGFERSLARAGLGPVAGADEAGRGACAGPLVVAAVVLPEGRAGQVAGLADSKLLTAEQREAVHRRVLARALAWSVVVVPPGEVDRRGLHVVNLEAMRRALARLDPAPAYALTDGFPVRGLPVPALAVWKGDRVAACVAAASVVAKVTRDRLLLDLHARFPAYGFDEHKGYSTPAHAQALRRHGPCPEHRFSYVNVAGALPGGAGTDARVPPRTLLRVPPAPQVPRARPGAALPAAAVGKDGAPAAPCADGGYDHGLAPGERRA